jgi:proline iminopeptidase
VGDGHRIAWSIAGNPDGKPAVVLHGGPGTGASPGFRRWFDPARYRVVLFDQRSCGKSTPHASDPTIDLSTNTTAHLVADIERLREHLHLDRWLVWGGSWGSTLALAYGEDHPDQVTEMILVSVVTTTRREVEWVTRAMGRVFPREWEAFRDVVPAAERDGDLAAAYSRMLHDPDPVVRSRAALGWCTWEDTHVATHPGHEHDERYDDPAFRLCFARLVTHYWANAAFLDDGQLLRDATRLAGIPGVLITGRLDISGPPDVAWQLVKRWPDAELVIIDDVGHGAGARTTEDEIIAATTRFSR